MKATKKRKSANKNTAATILKPGVAAVSRKPPTLDEICCQLEDLFAGVMSGETDLNKARLGQQIKRVQMKRFDYAVQMARMNPALRQQLPGLLGLPAPATREIG